MRARGALARGRVRRRRRVVADVTLEKRSPRGGRAYTLNPTTPTHTPGSEHPIPRRRDVDARDARGGRRVAATDGEIDRGGELARAVARAVPTVDARDRAGGERDADDSLERR